MFEASKVIEVMPYNSELKSPLGTLPKGWELVQLKDVTTKIGSGATPKGGEKVYISRRESHAFVRSQNVFDRHFESAGLVYITNRHAAELRNVELQDDDILLNITGDGITFGRACLVPRSILPACVNQHVSIIRTDQSRCLPGFLISYLCHPIIKGYIESFNAGGSRRAITKGHIESFKVPLPPISVQERIADVLSTLDDKIELNRQMNETLEAMARRLFRSWFVDFDPVHAKAAARREFPGLDNAELSGRALPNMAPEIAELFPDTFQDSPLGPIPKGWNAGAVGDSFNLTMGQSPPGSTYNDVGLGMPFYQGKTDFQTRFPARRVFCTAPTRTAKRFDTLVSVRAPVGAVNMAGEDCSIGRGIAAIRHRSGSTSFTYYSMLDKEEAFQRFEADGTVFGSINKSDFEKLQVIIPPDQIVNAFDSKTAGNDELICSNSSKIENLVSIRDKLLPKLLSGEISVR